MATEPLEKKVTSRDIPCGSSYFQLWQGEEVDFTILSHYFDCRLPTQTLQQNPQTKQFTISIEPCKHYILPRASYVTFETRIVQVDGNEHKKLPPVTPPKMRTSSERPCEKTSQDKASFVSANGSFSPNVTGQSEVRSSSPLIQRHFSHGTKFVLEQGQGHGQGQRSVQKQGQGQQGCDVGQGTSQGGTGDVQHGVENTEQMRLSAEEIEKRKQQEKVKMKRMENWIKQQDERQRRRDMIERQREQRDEDERRCRKRRENEEFMSKRRRLMSKCEPTKVNEEKRKETLQEKTVSLNDAYLGVNFDNSVGTLIFKDIDLRINGCSVTSLYGNYNIQSFIMMLGLSSDARASKFENQLWFNEPTANEFDVTNPSNYKKRFDLFKESNWVKVSSALYLPLNLQNR